MDNGILFVDEEDDSKEACKLFPVAHIQNDGGVCPLLITEDGMFEGIKSIRTYHEILKNEIEDLVDKIKLGMEDEDG